MKVKLDPGAIMPTRAHATDAGLDLYSMDDKVIFPRQVTMFDKDGFGKPVPIGETFDTGVHIAFDPGTYGRVEGRSGLNINKNICVCGAGIIDNGFRGSIKVKLYNMGTEPYTVKKGDRIAQLIIAKYETPEIELVTALDDTDRGESGFGSSGL